MVAHSTAVPFIRIVWTTSSNSASKWVAPRQACGEGRTDEALLVVEASSRYVLAAAGAGGGSDSAHVPHLSVQLEIFPIHLGVVRLCLDLNYIPKPSDQRQAPSA